MKPGNLLYNLCGVVPIPAECHLWQMRETESETTDLSSWR